MNPARRKIDDGYPDYEALLDYAGVPEPGALSVQHYFGQERRRQKMVGDGKITIAIDDLVVDVVTGIRGVVTGFSTWKYDNDQAWVEWASDGGDHRGGWFYLPRLEVVPGKADEEVAGPTPAPDSES